MRLKNQVALITGAASGIGKAQAILFAEQGAKIIAADVNLTGAQSVADTIVSKGGDATAISLDVTDQKSIDDLVSKSLDKYGQITILCNTAGMFDNYVTLGDTSEELWLKVIDINVSGLFRLTKAVLPSMIKNSYGNVINIASGAGLIGGGGGISYTSSKHAVIGFTKQLNAEYGRLGIRANAIAPGLIKTPMVQSVIDDKTSGIMDTLTKIPAGRYGLPEEVAQTALFLANDESKYIYGAVIPVDGGLLSTLR